MNGLYLSISKKLNCGIFAHQQESRNVCLALFYGFKQLESSLANYAKATKRIWRTSASWIACHFECQCRTPWPRQGAKSL